MRLLRKKKQGDMCGACETNAQMREKEGAALSVEGLCLSYGKETVLQDISFSLKQGEFISLFGPSGCGKSSILKSIAGLIPIDSGVIEIGGSDVTALLPERRGTVIVFQDLRLFPHMTAAQNLCFPMQLRGVPRAEQMERAEALLREVQLPGLGGRRVGALSGGQQQRVALARALAAAPRILLLDEPFSGLDETLRREMGQLVRRIHKERGLSTILVTHDREEAMQLSDRIALLGAGRLLQYDTPKRLYQQPSSREAAQYLGEASFLRGVVRDGVFSCPLFQVKTAHEDGVCEAVLRPGAVGVSVRERGVLCTVREAVFLGESVLLELDTPAGPLRVRTAPLAGRRRTDMASDSFAEAAFGEKEAAYGREQSLPFLSAGGFYRGQEVWVNVYEAHCI